ncbi:hypothetical protein GN958_ATG05749 [Phytophthora infestans]|uniref:Uncharacterized protein n=1 Tax=Phytophthora infestans TaxID=4787 RepID=A0A8S9V0T8_PHYIN|nr:hypothetical protein GN958_ATG05749 [Phytophthora infestans]
MIRRDPDFANFDQIHRLIPIESKHTKTVVEDKLQSFREMHRFTSDGMLTGSHRAPLQPAPHNENPQCESRCLREDPIDRYPILRDVNDIAYANDATNRLFGDAAVNESARKTN